MKSHVLIALSKSEKKVKKHIDGETAMTDTGDMIKYGQRAMNADRLGIKSIGQKRMSISGRGKHQPAAMCERCGSIGNIHAHHRDYTRPDDIMWVCPPCHNSQQSEDRKAGFDCSLSGAYHGKTQAVPTTEAQAIIGEVARYMNRKAAE